jgi:5-methylcytosine-specific restriction endonuclease McrA
MDVSPIRTARRNSRRLEKGQCLFCRDCGGPIEGDHVAGRNHDAHLIAPLCRRCHDAATENRRRAGAEMKRQPTSSKRVKYALEATAVFLHMLADAMRKWAEWL